MAISFSNIQEILEIGYNIEIQNQPEVGQFLDENPFLVPLLKLIFVQINNYFPENSLVLEFYLDPEIPNLKMLIIGILSTYDVEESLVRLRKLDKGWWLEFSPVAQNKILIDLRQS